MPKGKEEQYYDWPVRDARGGQSKEYESGGEVKQYKKGGFFSAERREERQERRNKRKIDKLQKKGVNIKTDVKSLEDAKKLKPTGKIRPGAKEVTVTEGGAFPAYKKKSVPAKSFRKAFAAARKAGKKTFKWDGRSYTTKTKEDKA